MIKVLIFDSYWRRGDYELEFFFVYIQKHIDDDKLHDVEYYDNLYHFLKREINKDKFVFTWEIFVKISNLIESQYMVHNYKPLNYFDDTVVKDDYLYPVNMRIRMIIPANFK